MNIQDIKCSDCKYWVSDYKSTQLKHLCFLSKQHSPKMSSACGLYTNKDFGCKLFEPKPTVITTPKYPPQDLTNFSE